MSELLPCPWCDSLPVETGSGYAVHHKLPCFLSHKTGSTYFTNGFAGWWNQRSTTLPTIERLQAENRILREGLNACASWGEGETVGSHFDEPGAAATAREYLAAADNLQNTGKGGGE